MTGIKGQIGCWLLIINLGYANGDSLYKSDGHSDN